MGMWFAMIYVLVFTVQMGKIEKLLLYIFKTEYPHPPFYFSFSRFRVTTL